MAISTLSTSKEIEKPLLQLLSDGREHRWREIVIELASYFTLSTLDLDERLPSGQKRFYHRCAFARLVVCQVLFVGRVEERNPTWIQFYTRSVGFR